MYKLAATIADRLICGLIIMPIDLLMPAVGNHFSTLPYYLYQFLITILH